MPSTRTRTARKESSSGEDDEYLDEEVDDVDLDPLPASHRRVSPKFIFL